jgi:hypothetical protein
MGFVDVFVVVTFAPVDVPFAVVVEVPSIAAFSSVNGMPRFCDT